MYWIKFHYWVIVYFIEGVWRRMWGLKEWQPPVISTGVNMLEEEGITVTPKPSASDALAHKAKFGINNIPEEYKKSIIWVISAIIFFFLFGVVDFVIRMTQLIKMYPIVGYVLLVALATYILYRVAKSIYSFFKNRRHKTIRPAIIQLWNNAVIRTQIKLTKK